MIDEIGRYFKANDPWDHLRATGQNRGQEYYFKNAPWNTYIALKPQPPWALIKSPLIPHFLNTSSTLRIGTREMESPILPISFAGCPGRGFSLVAPQHTVRTNYDSFVPYTTAEWHGLDSVQHIGPYLRAKGIDISLFTDADKLVFDSDGAAGARRVQMMRNGTRQYVAYHPNSANATMSAVLKSSVARMKIDLTEAPGTFRIEWFRASDGITRSGGSVAGGAIRDFAAPWAGADVVLYLNRTAPP